MSSCDVPACVPTSVARALERSCNVTESRLRRELMMCLFTAHLWREETARRTCFECRMYMYTPVVENDTRARAKDCKPAAADAVAVGRGSSWPDQWPGVSCRVLSNSIHDISGKPATSYVPGTRTRPDRSWVRDDELMTQRGTRDEARPRSAQRRSKSGPMSPRYVPRVPRATCCAFEAVTGASARPLCLLLVNCHLPIDLTGGQTSPGR